jgi:hypothetical protein
MRGEMLRDARAVVLEKIAIKPRSFLDLAGLTMETNSSLRQVLESLIAEGRIGRTSNGFETIYFLQDIERSSTRGETKR